MGEARVGNPPFDDGVADACARAAWAQGATFLIGVRAHNGSWFAHCDGKEVDGANPADAAYSLIGVLTRKAKAAASQSNAEAKSLDQRAADLTAIYLETDNDEATSDG